MKGAAKMTEMRIAKQIENNANDWSVKNGNITLISSDIVKHYFIYNFGAFFCRDLYNKFVWYNVTCAPDFAKALNAWNATYNPLHNYDGKETTVKLNSHGVETVSNEKTRTDNLTQSTDNTPDSTRNTVTNETTDGTKTTTYSSTYDNENLKKTGETVPNGGNVTTYNLKTNTTTENTGTQSTEDETTRSYLNATITHNGKTYSAHDVEINEIEKGGNLGVTTSQQMIQSEVEMRLNPIITQYLNRFASQYFFYVGGEIE